MCEVMERYERKARKEGIAEGRAEGQNILVETIERIRNGETSEQLLASGVDQKNN